MRRHQASEGLRPEPPLGLRGRCLGWERRPARGDGTRGDLSPGLRFCVSGRGREGCFAREVGW